MALNPSSNDFNTSTVKYFYLAVIDYESFKKAEVTAMLKRSLAVPPAKFSNPDLNMLE